MWWGLLGALQWVLFAALVAGLLWLALLAGATVSQLIARTVRQGGGTR